MKKVLPHILTAIFPYYIVFALHSIFFNSIFIEKIFRGDGLLLAFSVLIFWAAAFICTIIAVVVSLISRWDSYQMLRINMIIKLLQIPAYILIFIIGLACFITIFTLGISIILVILDCMAIFLSGLIGASAIATSCADGRLPVKTSLICGILQFVFIADVISAVIVFRNARMMKKRYNY